MDSFEGDDKRNPNNTEYLATKCRITKPPPPKPATNPMQFVKVAPCPLFQKAHEQIRKVEEIKRERKEVKEEAEDWQLNLDNWKSSRRKRQEHIIERVVEVKKLEQEEQEKSRRKSKTFSEMMGDRRHKISIPIYDDDSNDLSDYGIGSSSSKTNSIKDVDTDDSNSILDEKENFKDNSSTSNQSEDETNMNPILKDDSQNNNEKPVQKSSEQYTYEGAIQDYRSRIQSKINVDESIFTKSKDFTKSKEFSEAQTVVPKGEIFKRKELFEGDKNVEINTYESNTSRRLSEDFANTRSIKDRLKSLEQSTDQSLKTVDKNDIQVSVKERLQSFNKQEDNTNNNKPKPNKISNYLLDKNSFEAKSPTEQRCSSPETEMFVNRMNMFDKDLDFISGKRTTSIDNGIDECCSNSNYPPSTSSVELTGLSSDREDSGIHTADVSCSVSQADEPIDTDTEIAASTIPSCIEKLAQEQEYTKEDIKMTDDLLEELRKDSSENLAAERDAQLKHITEMATKVEEVEEPSKPVYENVEIRQAPPPQEPEPVANYENIEIKSFSTSFIEPIPQVDFLNSDLMGDSPFTMSTTLKEPPKAKPPPPPPQEDSDEKKPVKRMNSTKRIKKEIHLKRSSFLGLDEPTDDQIDPDMGLERPPDITSYLQKESKLEKSLYKKMHEERMGSLSKVESQDSGLDIDRGRLSSDTWCSSVGDSSLPSHERQDSEQTNSITSEEDEITKKEREIIEMVEKEEQSRDPPTVDYINEETSYKPSNESIEPCLGSEQFKNPYFPQQSSEFDDCDSEVLKVEQELRQLEREEMERKRENVLFRESRAKARLQNNRHSLENICDEIYPGADYRKSMPDLPHIPLEYIQSVPDVPNNYRHAPHVDVEAPYRKSMPDIQHVYQNTELYVDNRKSMPDLQQHRSAFKSPPIQPGAPIKPQGFASIDSHPKRPLTKHNLHALSAAPRPRHTDNWIQPKPKAEKSYNQHWLYQEAELRRISEQKYPRKSTEKPLPDSIIQSLTQMVQNRGNPPAPPLRRPDQSPNRNDFMQHPYIGGNPQTLGHAMPLSYAPPIHMDDSQDRMLSVSGKKKCSFCGHELGRGAAMIIESLHLFYHMDCFKCCVCHMQLGDGRMGTDVRVRNQKLHCQNCYSSDDGVKFSCV